MVLAVFGTIWRNSTICIIAYRPPGYIRHSHLINLLEKELLWMEINRYEVQISSLDIFQFETNIIIEIKIPFYVLFQTKN